MSGVESYDPGAMFIFRTWKHDTAEPDFEWTNAYEVKADMAGDAGFLSILGVALLDFEKFLHGTTIEFSRTTISTWVPDSHPYDPLNFLVTEHPSGTLGTQNILLPLPLRVAWAMKRTTPYGRSGKLYLRGCLGEGDVNKGIQGYSLTDPAAMALRVNAAIGDAGLNDYLGEVVINGLGLSLIGLPKGVVAPQVRRVWGILSHGVVDVQMNHRWFNRAVAP